jgi:hypothetical protein
MIFINRYIILAHFMKFNIIKTNFMNKNILMASAITAGAAAFFYVLRNKGRLGESVKQIVGEHSRHLTNAFSKAKQIKTEG